MGIGWLIMDMDVVDWLGGGRGVTSLVRSSWVRFYY